MFTVVAVSTGGHWRIVCVCVFGEGCVMCGVLVL